jgi:hypothetical protein
VHNRLDSAPAALVREGEEDFTHVPTVVAPRRPFPASSKNDASQFKVKR